MKYNVSAERTAEILIERHGRSAFEFAARQCAYLNLTDAQESLDEWRVIALAIERMQRRGAIAQPIGR